MGMAKDPVMVGVGRSPPKDQQKDGRQYKSHGRQHVQKGGGGFHSKIRKPVLALCKATNAAAAAPIAKSLKAALLEAEQGNEPVDGGLLGMAAAQAGRLGLKDLLSTLCAYSWPRLSSCGGREVAELAAAASKCCCEDDRFFCFVAVYCCQSANAFSCLRDVALVATALSRKLDTKVDVCSAFHGLTAVALLHLRGSLCPIRDIAEFFYSLVNLLSAPSGASLVAAEHVRDAIQAMAISAGPQLHKASAQDIAKTTGAASMAWSLFPQLQEHTLQPLLQELAQAVRFRHTDFNAQDVAHLSVAFAKVDTIPDFSTSLPVLLDKVLENLKAFSSKDLSLVLWAASRNHYIGERCSSHVMKEVMRRDLSAFSAQDLCMMAQCLAKMGGRGKAALCLVAGQVFARQANGLNTTDKVLFLWALAKCKVMHLALCRLLVRDLAVENCSGLPRDKVGLALWSLAVVWPSLPDDETWRHMLATVLLQSQPWLMAPAYEVTNAFWALAQLPEQLTARSWPSLVQTVTWVQAKQLSEHELCNLLYGLSSSMEVPALTEAFGIFATELAERLERYVSEHDRRLLQAGLARRPTLWHTLEAAQLDRIKAFLNRKEDGKKAWSHGEGQEEPFEEEEGSVDEAVASEKQAREEKCSHEGHGHEAHCDHAHGHEEETLDAEEEPWKHGCKSYKECHDLCCTQVGDQNVLSRLRLNSHCTYKGHCVQLKHTFIHVDCPADSDEDCMICTMSRRRARSADSKTPNAQGPGTVAWDTVEDAEILQ